MISTGVDQRSYQMTLSKGQSGYTVSPRRVLFAERGTELKISPRLEVQLKVWNGQVIFARLARRPGEIKSGPHRAGNTSFASPELVLGTLMKGFEFIRATPGPQARTALVMFVVAEVHPLGGWQWAHRELR